jgi:hypothetical protein
VIGINPEYFLDAMSQDEIKSIMEAKTDHEKIRWEQTRLIAYYTVVAQTGTKNIKYPTDLFKFGWDNKIVEIRGNRLTREEFLNSVKL